MALLGFTTASNEVRDTQILIYDADGIEVTNGEFLSRLPYYPNTNLTSSIGDRFLGAYVEGGISRIEINGSFPVDHLQYGYAVPEPSAFLLTGLSLTFLLRRPCRSAGKSLS